LSLSAVLGTLFSIIISPLIIYKGKGRGKVKANFTVEQATKAQRGSRGIAILVL
jgi:hypothetical protein